MTEAEDSISALIDSGSTANFIHSRIVQKLNLPTKKLKIPVSVSTIDGSTISSGKIYRKVVLPFELQGQLFQEGFLISNIGRREAVLGTPFLNTHNPAINWQQRTVELAKESNAIDLEGLPKEYHDFADVFGEGFFENLPPHRPYDLAIDLKEGTTPLFGPIYATTRQESIALREQIKENLDKGTIRHSTSPAASPVMFVPKKDGGLRMCVDFRKLNAITVKNRYLLPLQSELFEKLREAKIFTKFDLRSGNHNV